MKEVSAAEIVSRDTECAVPHQGELAPSGHAVFTKKTPEVPVKRGKLTRVPFHVSRLMGDDYGVIVKLLMLTGQRANEIAGLRWSEVDLQRGLISLPGERTKNGKPHDIAIAASVRSLLEAREKSDRDLIFGRGDGPFSGWSRAKTALDKRIGALKHWTIHDLRRSVATGMADIGIQPHVIEAVLNHVSGHKGGIAGIYNRAQYSAEKAQALARWDEHIRTVVEGSPKRVVELRGRR
jgi:integrase